MGVPIGLEPFVDQTPREHVLVVLSGIVACVVGYIGAAALLFDLSVLDHGGPDLPRWIVSCVASIACWTVYSAAFVRGKSGPVTSALVYPIATVAIAPFAVRWIGFGPNWSAIRDRISLFFFDAGLLVDAAMLVIPGVSIFVFVLSVWASGLDETEIREWQRRHLSEEFRNAFVEEGEERTLEEEHDGR